MFCSVNECRGGVGHYHWLISHRSPPFCASSSCYKAVTTEKQKRGDVRLADVCSFQPDAADLDSPVLSQFRISCARSCMPSFSVDGDLRAAPYQVQCTGSTFSIFLYLF